MLQPSQALSLAADHHVHLQPLQQRLQRIQHPTGEATQVHQPERDEQLARRRVRTAGLQCPGPGCRVVRSQQRVGGAGQHRRARGRERRIVPRLAAQGRVDQQPAMVGPIGQVIDGGDGQAEMPFRLGAQTIMVDHDQVRRPARRPLPCGVHQGMQRTRRHRQALDPGIRENLQQRCHGWRRDHGAGRAQVQQRARQRQAAHDVSAPHPWAAIGQEQDPAVR